MRQNEILKTLISLVLVAVVCFGIGFTWSDVSAAASEGKGPVVAARSTVTALLSIPDKLEMLLDKPTDPALTLEVRTTYQETLNTIRGKFFPQAATLNSVVVKTPGNSVTPEAEVREPSVDVNELTYMAIRGILGALEDPFTGFLDPQDYKRMREENEGNFVGIGAQLWTNKEGQVYVKEPLENAPAIKAGVKKGDVILKVDGKSVADKDIEEVVKMIRGEEDTTVTLTLGRGKEQRPVVISIVRKWVEYEMVKHEMLDEPNGIGWLQLRQFNDKADEQITKAITDLESHHMKGLVLDLRGNPGGLLESAVDVGSRFIESGPVVIIQERGGQRNSLNVDPSKQNLRHYPLVVLVDEMSASASEIVAGAVKDTRAGTIVGTKTFGKGRVQTIVPLGPSDGAVRITTAKYLTPRGTDINEVGIEPDIMVAMPEDLPEEEEAETDRMKYDPQLRRAVEVLRDKLVASRSGKPHAMR